MFTYNLFTVSSLSAEHENTIMRSFSHRIEPGTNLSNAAVRKNSKSGRKGAVLLLQEQWLPQWTNIYSASMFSAFFLLFKIFCLVKAEWCERRVILQLFFLWLLTDLNSVDQKWKYILEFPIRNILICPQLRHNTLCTNMLFLKAGYKTTLG